jgi:L-ribulose-5-phosphate 3-epimerase
MKSTAGGLGGTKGLSRRDFILRALLATGGAASLDLGLAVGAAEGLTACPIVVFSKVYQELKLSFEDAAAVTAEAGLDGVDPPVRTGGEILPERVTQDLPRYAEILRRQKLRMPLITSGITSTSSPHAEEVLRTAKGLGIKYYRLGFFEPDKKVSGAEQARNIRAQLKDLAAMNHEIGICALFQNHTGSFGADLDDLWAVVNGLSEDQVGIAFDIGHAILAHGKQWRPRFDQLKSHMKVAYIKDAKPSVGWVPFGEGDVASAGYFQLLKEMQYHEPFCLHLEYDWSGKEAKNRQLLVKSLKQNAAVLKTWLAKA